MMKIEMKDEWVSCPVCKSKTRVKARKDTVLLNFPLFCPKCKREVLIDAAAAAQAMSQGIRPEKTAADIRRGAVMKPQNTEAPISTRQETKSAVRACLSAMRMRPTLCIS